MTVTIYPSKPTGQVKAPPSKSMAHRLLICAGLASGKSRIEGISYSEDILATIDCLKALGAEIETGDTYAEVTGTDPKGPACAVLPCRESGSTLRFIIPVCMLSPAETRLVGSDSLMNRPLIVYERLFAERGLQFKKSGNSLSIKGKLPPGTYSFAGNVSSQFASGLLFALPLLGEDSRIELMPPVESRPYIDMTVSALNGFGVKADWVNETEITIPGCQRYMPRELTVEGDWSNSAFLIAMGIPVTGLDDKSLQGDRICTEYYAALDDGCPVLDISDCPDLGPVLFAYAAMHSGGRFTGTDRLRLKESDRCESMKAELEKFGTEVIVGENEITVRSGISRPKVPLDSHNDHRIAMAMSVLCAAVGGTIRGAEAVSKSFPDYFEVISSAGIEAVKDEMDI